MDNFYCEEFQDSHSSECDYDDVWRDEWHDEEYPVEIVGMSVPWWTTLLPEVLSEKEPCF